LTIVTFIDTPDASTGIVHDPFDPSTAIVCVSRGPSGVDRPPTVAGAGRVSITRQGVIGTNTERTPPVIDADAGIKDPQATDAATALVTMSARLRSDLDIDIRALPRQ